MASASARARQYVNWAEMARALFAAGQPVIIRGYSWRSQEVRLVIDLSTLSDEDQALAMQAASTLTPEVVMQLMEDAQRASELRDEGDLEGARAVLAPHREIAVRAGLESVFDSLLG